MGIVFVLFFYLLVLGVMAVISSLVLTGGIAFYLRRVGRPKKLLALARLLPFGSVLYAGLWFVGYAVVSDRVFHHDPMIGDGWYTDIGDGYAIDMIDVTDQGTVHPITGEGRGLNNPEGVSGVRRLQIASPYLVGSQDSKGFEHLGQESTAEDRFFIIDTRSHARSNFSSESSLREAVTQLGMQLKLKPISRVYDEQRSRWFDMVAAAVLFGLPAAALWHLLASAFRLKQNGLRALAIDPGT